MTGTVLGVWVSSVNKAKTLPTFILQGRLTINTINQEIIEFVRV